jgi:hydroxyethylthiazole kinase-like uncharacterized protein yjeF
VEFDAGKIHIVTPGSVRLPARRRDINKFDCGRVLVIGGSVGYTGAPVMCAKAALRAGAGLVYAAVPQAAYQPAAAQLLEAMPFPLPDDGGGRFSENALPVLLERLKGCDVCVIGPGLGRSEALAGLVRAVIENCRVPLILDADALWAVSLDPAVLDGALCPIIVTPHAGEFARMGGRLGTNPAPSAAAFTAAHGCVTVLKGPETAAAFPDGEVFVSRLGNPGMATGGSGDVLAGLIGGLCGQLELKAAVNAGIYIHGMSAGLCREKFGEYSMLPGDMIEAVPEIMKNMVK